MLLQLLNDRPRDRTCRETLAGNYLSLGVLAGWAGQYGQELEFEKQGMEIARGLVQDYPTDQDVLRTMNSLQGNYYNSLKKLGSIDEAKELLKPLHESSEKLVALFPTVIDFVRQYRTWCVNYSRDLYNRGDHSAAISLANGCRERIGLIKNQSSKDDIEDLSKLENFATLEYIALLLEENRYFDAIKQLEKLDFDNVVFDPARLTRNTVVHADVRFLNNCQDDYWVLKRPDTMIRECVDLAGKDELLTISSKRELTATLRRTAERCEAEAQKLYDTWRDKLAAYIARRSKDAEGTNIWPTAANLMRLDREAKALLGG